MISQNWYIDIVRKVFLKDVNLEDIHILGDHRFVYIANKERSHKGIWWDFYWAIEHSNSRGPYIMYTCNLLRGDLRQIENRWSGHVDNLPGWAVHSGSDQR